MNIIDTRDILDDRCYIQDNASVSKSVDIINLKDKNIIYSKSELRLRKINELIQFRKSNNEKILISVEGNIGSGKSSLITNLKRLLKNDDIELHHEPVDKWTNCEGENILEHFYTNPKEIGLSFQMLVLASRIEKQNQSKTISIVERCPIIDICFAYTGYCNGILSNPQAAVFIKVIKSIFQSNQRSKPNGILYLRTPPNVCYNRMNYRGRKEEITVPLAYIEQLHIEHDKMFRNINQIENNSIVNEKLKFQEKFEELYRLSMINNKEYNKTLQRIPVIEIDGTNNLIDDDSYLIDNVLPKLLALLEST